MVNVKENVKETKSKDDVCENKITIGEVYGLNGAIVELSASVPTMKGKIVFALAKNEGKIESILKKVNVRREDIMKKYVKLNKDGTYDLTKLTDEQIEKGERPEYIYLDKKNGKIEATKEVQNLMEEEINIDFHKIWKNDFDNLDITPSRVPNIGLLIKYLVSEEYDLHRLQ